MVRIAAIFMTLVLMLGCQQKSEAPKTEQAKQNITIAQFGHVFLYLPLYVAKDKGFFDEEGLNVTVISTGGDEKTFAAVSSGSAQFGVADPTFVAIAAEKGQKGKVIASLVNGVPFWGIAYSDKIKEIRNTEDFKGLRIATYSAPSTNYAVMKKILQNNGKPVNAKIVEGAFGSLVAMLKSGKANIAMELEPVTSIAAADGAKVVYSMPKTFGDFAFTGVTAADDYIGKNPETVQKVLNALSKAMKYSQNDFNGTLAVAKSEFPEVNEETLKNGLRRLLDEGTIPKTPEMSPAAWDKAISLRVEVGDLKEQVPFASSVDMSFAKKAAVK